jgi:hypothetical protein
MLPRAIAASMFFLVVVAASGTAAAQTFETLGTRAGGMGGAFVAVADDATAVYWNPAGLALSGSLFSLVIETGQDKAEPDDLVAAGRRSASMVALTTPPLGLAYYRLSFTKIAPLSAVLTASAVPAVNVERLITHHAGVTVVQQLTTSIAIAVTGKMVHGNAVSAVVLNGNRDDLFDSADDLPDKGTTKFDADIGVMARLRAWRAGLTVRNITEPEFTTAGADPLELKRQTRAGVAFLGVAGLIASADVDIERQQGSLGEERNFAGGGEARIMPRLFVRSGIHFNTLSDQPGGRAFVYSLGAGVIAYRALTVDARVTLGSNTGDRGWSVAGRLAY